jgi:hypothetical protein
VYGLVSRYLVVAALLLTSISKAVSLITNAAAAFTVSDNGLSANPNALVARKVIDPLAVAVGVPDRTPPEEKDIPVGNVPLASDQVIGAVPVAVKVVVG